MDEQYLQDLLSAYLDNELTAEQKAAVDQYLATNPEAREQLARLERLNQLVEGHSGLDGEDYWEESASKIEQQLGITGTQVTVLEPERRKRTGLWWKLTSIAASVAILVFVGLHQTDIMGPDLSKETISPTPTSLTKPPVDVTADSDAVETSPSVLSQRTPSGQPRTETSATPEPDLSATDRIPKNDVQPGLAASVDKPEQVGGQEAQSDLNYMSESVLHDTKGTDTKASAPVSAEEVSPPPRQSAAAVPAEAPPEDGGDEEMRKVAVDKIALRRTGLSLPEKLKSEENRESDRDRESKESELARCREVRDSLTEQLAGLNKSNSRRLSKAVGAVPPQSLVAEPEADSVDRRAELEDRLADAWLFVLYWGADSTETAQGMEYLRRLAADSLSTTRVKAADYLERIRRNQEGPAAFE